MGAASQRERVCSERSGSSTKVDLAVDFIRGSEKALSLLLCSQKQDAKMSLKAIYLAISALANLLYRLVPGTAARAGWRCAAHRSRKL
jgi:hypothetical protein